MKKLLLFFLLPASTLLSTPNYSDLYELLHKICAITEGHERPEKSVELGNRLRILIGDELSANPDTDYCLYTIAAASFPEQAEKYITQAVTKMPSDIRQEINERFGTIAEAYDAIDHTKTTFSRVEREIIENFLRLSLAHEALEKYDQANPRENRSLKKRILKSRWLKVIQGNNG